MYRFIIILSAFLAFTQACFSETIITQSPYFPAYNPYYQRQYAYNHYYNPHIRRIMNNTCSQNINELSALEKYAMNKNFSGDSELTRLQRLEMQAFGAIQQGDFNSRYENVRSAILSRPKAHTNNSILRAIGDYFGGQITGFTPPLTAYPADRIYTQYPSSFGNSSVVDYVTPYGRGYRVNNFNTSSSGGIRILD